MGHFLPNGRSDKVTDWQYSYYKVTRRGIPLFIGDDHLDFFSQFGKAAEVSAIKRKTVINSGGREILVTVDRKKFVDIPNVLICGGRPIYEVIEGRQPLC